MNFPFTYDHGAPMSFGGAMPTMRSFDESRAVILPIPVDRTTSYVSGTRNGPREIIEASSHMELWDEEVGADVHGIGIYTLPPMELPFGEMAPLMDEIRRVASEILSRGKFLVSLGGEHSITPPLVAAAAGAFKGLSVLQIDAHADFVPFGELFPFRGFARKIYDGSSTGVTTTHGVQVRSDFASKYPEVVVAYLKATLEADRLFREKPEELSEKLAGWTGVDAEVYYAFHGPQGIQTRDYSLKPEYVTAIRKAQSALKVLKKVDKETKALKIDTNDEVVKGTLVTQNGQVLHPSLQS